MIILKAYLPERWYPPQTAAAIADMRGGRRMPQGEQATDENATRKRHSRRQFLSRS